VNRSNDPSFRRATSFVQRHRWGVSTLAVAFLLWALGAVATPAPAMLGGILAALAALLLLALGRLAARRRVAFAVAERRRTRTSLALYASSVALGSLFLAGLFAVPGSTALDTGVASAPTASRLAAALPWISTLQPGGAVAAAQRLATELPALHEIGTTLPLVAERSMGRDTLRILSFNVWHGYPGPGARPERYQRIRELIEESAPDVVLLQEAWTTRRFGSLAERLSRDLDLKHAYTRANGSLRYLGFEEGLAILSPHPISEVRRLALGPRTPPWEMRAALGAAVSLPGGDPIEVWTTHLSHSDAFAREGQARSLAAALVDSEVALLAGDFNAVASDPAVTVFADLELRPVLSDGIDHILASPALRAGWTVVSAEARRFGETTIPGSLVTRPEVSDHPALLVELRREPATPGGAMLAVVASPGSR
jgi:endonuclease/exonuclease/phosphatase family metal-dependent hydrolase